MVYATYAYYTQDYGGTTLTEAEWPKYARRASAEVDHVTFDRLKHMDEEQIIDAVRDAVCEVAEKLHRFETMKGRDLAAENNDGYSVSFRDPGTQSARQDEVRLTIRTYLANTGLMYRGWSEEYDCCKS